MVPFVQIEVCVYKSMSWWNACYWSMTKHKENLIVSVCMCVCLTSRSPDQSELDYELAKNELFKVAIDYNSQN